MWSGSWSSIGAPSGGGGGEVYFDDELIRQDGLFVTGDLKLLNPENLK